VLCLVVGCSEPEPSTFSACYLVGTTTTEDAGEGVDLLGELAAASSLKLTFRNETTRNWAWSDGEQAIAPRWSVRVGTCRGEWRPWSPATGDAQTSSP
jgi:hypothetical protein